MHPSTTNEPRSRAKTACITHLPSANEKFEPLRKPLLLPVVLGQRTHDLRMLRDERGMNDVVLQELPHERVQHSHRREGGRALQPEFLQYQLELRLDHRIVERRQFLPDFLLDAPDHRYALEGGGEVDLHLLGIRLRLVFDLVPPRYLHDHAAEHLLGHVHQVLVICVRLVRLARRELRVVRQVDALVAELPSDLVHPIESSDDEHLEVQLRRDPHEHLERQVVVVGDERTRHGPAGDHVHHRRFHLEEVSVVEIPADVIDDLGPPFEDDAIFVVHDEVEVAHAVSRFHVRERRTVPPRRGLGEHMQARTQELHLEGEDG